MSAILFRFVSGLSVAASSCAVIAYAGRPLDAPLHSDVRAVYASNSAGVLQAHIFAAAVALRLGLPPWVAGGVTIPVA